MKCPVCGGELERTGPAALARPILPHSAGGAGTYLCQKCYREYTQGWWIYPCGSEPKDEYFEEKCNRYMILSAQEQDILLFRGGLIGFLFGFVCMICLWMVLP